MPCAKVLRCTVIAGSKSRRKEAFVAALTRPKRRKKCLSEMKRTCRSKWKGRESRRPREGEERARGGGRRRGPSRTGPRRGIGRGFTCQSRRLKPRGGLRGRRGGFAISGNPFGLICLFICRGRPREKQQVALSCFLAAFSSLNSVCFPGAPSEGFRRWAARGHVALATAGFPHLSRRQRGRENR